MRNNQKHREGKFAEKPGQYEIAVRLSDTLMNPGSELIIEVYFSGYGEISQPAMKFYPSSDFFEPSESEAIFGTKKEERSGKTFFGAKKAKVDAVGNHLPLGVAVIRRRK